MNTNPPTDPSFPPDQTLRHRIAKTLAATELKPPFPHCLAMADTVLAVLPEFAEAHRLALSEALGLGTGAPWDAIHDRATELGLPPLAEDPVAQRLGLVPVAADRAAVLREAADHLVQVHDNLITDPEVTGKYLEGMARATAELRRLAVEAQPEASPLGGRKTGTAFSPGEGVHGQDPYYDETETPQPDTETPRSADVDPVYDPKAWETYRRDTGCGCTAPAPVACKVPHGTGAWLCACHRLSGPPTTEPGKPLTADEEATRRHFSHPNRCLSVHAGIFRCERPTGHPGGHRMGRTFWGRRPEDDPPAPAEQQPAAAVVQHAPGKVICCPDCRAKGRMVCMNDAAPAAGPGRAADTHNDEEA